MNRSDFNQYFSETGLGRSLECLALSLLFRSLGEGFDVHAVLEGQRCEGLAKFVEANMFAPRDGQDLLVGVPERVRVVHRPRLWGREQIRAVRTFLTTQDWTLRRESVLILFYFVLFYYPSIW